MDAESDGRPDATASGDDRNGADEDGVVFTSTLHVGQDATIEVAASTEGYLNAWIDFDGDGQFDDREDTIFADQALTRGVNRLTFPVPAYAASGWTFARFRFNTRGLLDSFGPADDGEVEDYRVQIVASHDPQAVSGATRLAWNQPPSLVADGSNQVFQPGGVPSALHLHEIAADDWQPANDQPVTGIHWWGTFDRWTESYLPPDLPLAFHIGIWTNVPNPEPYSFDTFAHPGTLIWETYCTSWTWAVSGHEASDRQGRAGTDVLPVQPPALAGSMVRGQPGGPGQGRFGIEGLLAEHRGPVRSDRRGAGARVDVEDSVTTASDAAGTSLQDDRAAVEGSRRGRRPSGPSGKAAPSSAIASSTRWTWRSSSPRSCPWSSRLARRPSRNAGAAIDHGELAVLAADWLNAVR